MTRLHVGLDIGSTTVKGVVVDGSTGQDAKTSGRVPSTDEITTLMVASQGRP